jgi:carboxymethylenebutenolidase
LSPAGVPAILPFLETAMDRKTAKDFDQELLDLFDQYVHGGVDRRGFIDRAAKFAVGGVTAAMLLDMLSPKFADAQQVPKDDARLKTQYVEYPSPQGNFKTRAYLARPAAAGNKPLPAILVVHENRGLNPHIEDIARRLALDNFMALAPDALAPLGGYPGDEDRARELFPKLDQTKTREDFVTAATWLKSRVDCTGRFGAVGFCYGGGIVNMLATRMPDLSAGVPFYGGQPPVADVPKIKAAMLVQYAEQDERINAGWPAYEAALKANKITYEGYIYPGTQHGFNNDTTPRYDQAAAKLAWQRTVDWFNKYVRL